MNPTPPIHPRGTSISSKEIDQGKFLTINDTPLAKYQWDTGVAIGKYLEGLRGGKLLGTECLQCHKIVIPPRGFCERCYTTAVQWRDLKDTGRVNTFSICHVSWDAKRVDTPYLPAVIEIDGASPGCGILHLLQNVRPSEIKIGMKVKAVWKPSNQRTGAITDIQYFDPIKE